MKVKHKILSTAIVSGTICLMFLYSPMGSPDLYLSPNSYRGVHSMGVQFSGRNMNSAMSVRQGVNQSTDFESITDFTSSSAVTESNPASLNAAPFIHSSNVQSAYQSKRQVVSVNTTPVFFAARSAARSSAAASEQTTANNVGILDGVASLEANLGSPRSSVIQYTAGAGATDPGSDPLGSTIPVSDGWGFLFLVALAYGGLKFRKLRTT